jgi:hypothetical protein
MKGGFTMTPLAAKILLGMTLVALYFIWKIVFRDTLKGEAGASMILFVCLAPTAAMIGIVLLLFLGRMLYYLISTSSLFHL